MKEALRTGVSRRTVLRAAGAVIVGGLSGRTTASPGPRPVSTNDQIRVGVIGVGVRGKFLIANLPPAARVTAICDCAASRIAETLEPKGDFAAVLARFREADAPRCTSHQDYRKMLDEEELDAVIIATPDHHHVPAAMLALRAGLDVYLEKPMTLTISEGRRLTNMVRTTGRVLQVGSQQRTMEINRFACEFIRKGGLGKISRVDLPNYPGPIQDPLYQAEPVPEGTNWDLFCGPAPLRAHSRNLWVKDEFKIDVLLWRGWDLFRDFSGHMMTNWGGHTVDMAQYALGKDDTGPVTIEALPQESPQAAYLHWREKTPPPSGKDDRRFRPVTMRYSDGVELRFAHGPDFLLFHGEKGRLKMRRNFFETDPPGLASGGPGPEALDRWSGSGHAARPHLENWLDCVRTRGVPNAPAEVGHRTATICHLANLAREQGRLLRWDPSAERFPGDEEANALLDRPRRSGFELPTV